MALTQLWLEKKQGEAAVPLPVYGFADSLRIRPRKRLLQCVFPKSPSIEAFADNLDFEVVGERKFHRLLECKLNSSAKGQLGLRGAQVAFLIRPQKTSDQAIAYIPKQNGVGEAVQVIDHDAEFSALRQIRIGGRGIVEGTKDLLDREIKVRLKICYPPGINRPILKRDLPPGSINLHALGAPDDNPDAPELISIYGCCVKEAEYCKAPYEGIKLQLNYQTLQNQKLA